MKIQLSDHFTYKRLLRFVLPSILMMIFTSIYGVVDGLFVSNYAGKEPFAAINLIMPFLMLFGAIGFMFGTGGAAIVAVTLGEGFKKKANEYFSMIVMVVVVLGIGFTILALIVLKPVAILLGAKGEMLGYAVLYGQIILPSATFFMLQNVFQSIFITAGKPNLGFVITVIAGLTNIVGDGLFVAVFKWGLVGAALATALSQVVGGLIPILYFIRPNKSLLQLTKTKVDFNIIGKICINGSSEFMTSVSMSLVNMLYNVQLMHYAGADGVAAYGVIMYANFIFTAIFFGYSMGSSPLVSYHYGAGNKDELKNLFRKSVAFTMVAGALMMLAAYFLVTPLSRIFVGYDQGLFELTKHGFGLFSLCLIFMGMNIFGSGFFTALNNGLISALISFLRTLVFQIAAVFILPLILGLDGIWLAIVAAEVLAVVVTASCIVRQNRFYHYY